MAKLISRIYGDALFESAMEEGNVMTVQKEVKEIRQIFEKNKEITAVLNHPGIDKKEKVHFLEKLFKQKCTDNVMGFLILIVKKGRQEQMMEIFESFLNRVREAEGIGSLKITSATELTEKEKGAVLGRLLELTEYKGFETIYVVDDSLIGGLMIHLEDKVIDSSIKTKLHNMKKGLAKVSLSQ